MDEKETLKTSEKHDAQEVSDEALDQINGGGQRCSFALTPGNDVYA